jgi:purine-binding chemotaxis protein CheW
MTASHTVGLLRASRKSIDWESLHHRLAASGEALQRKIANPDEETERVLRERAKQLSKPAEIEIEGCFEVLEFQLGSESYGVNLSYSSGVYFLRDLMPVPVGPSFVIGAVNLQGRVVAVVDLRRWLDLPIGAATDLNRVIALHSGDVEVGILTHGVSGVRSISRSELQCGLPTLTGANAMYLEGLTRDGMILLDVRRLLSDPKLSLEEEF